MENQRAHRQRNPLNYSPGDDRRTRVNRKLLTLQAGFIPVTVNPCWSTHRQIYYVLHKHQVRTSHGLKKSLKVLQLLLLF